MVIGFILAELCMAEDLLKDHVRWVRRGGDARKRRSVGIESRTVW